MAILDPVCWHAVTPQLLAARDKYPHARDFELMALESLVLFDQADNDPPPDMLIDLQWHQVRCFSVAQAQDLGNEWITARSGK